MTVSSINFKDLKLALLCNDPCVSDDMTSAATYFSGGKVFSHKCSLLLSFCGLQIEWLLEIAKAFNEG